MQLVELATSDGKLVASGYIDSYMPDRAAKVVICEGRCFVRTMGMTPIEPGALVYEEISAAHVIPAIAHREHNENW